MNQPMQDVPYEDVVEDEANQNQSSLFNFRVAKCEYSRFILFGIMFGIIGFIYSFMRIIKDTYIMVRQDPICIPYIKLFYVLPLSFVSIILVNYMLSSRSVSRIFSIFMLLFTMIFFLFAAFILFEESIFFDHIHIYSLITSHRLNARGLGYFRDFLLTVNQPLATLIYLVAEMWGTLMLSYLFMSFLNEMCTRKQHARFLPPLFIIANISLLISALTTTGFFKIRSKLSYEQNIMLMAGIFAVEGLLGLAALTCKYILERRVMNHPIFIPAVPENDQNRPASTKKSKGTTSFAEGIEIMMQSKFLLAMSGIVFFYSITYNVLETVYKNGIKHGAEVSGEETGKYAGHFNNIDQYLTSLLVIFINLSAFSKLTETKGWRFVALISPLLAGLALFSILGTAIHNAGADGQSILLVNKLFLGSNVWITFENYMGMLFLSALKIFKFTAFDVSKENISMRIESRHRPKFKSVYDGIFNKMGKSGGAAFSIMINLIGSSIDLRGMSPITFILMIPCISFWIWAVIYLGKSYDKSIADETDIDLDLADEDEPEQQQHKLENIQEEKEKDAIIPDSKSDM